MPTGSLPSLSRHRPHFSRSRASYFRVPLLIFAPSQLSESLEQASLRQIIKKAQLSPIGEKVGTLSPFCRVLGIFLLNAQLGTGTSYACEMSIFKGTVSRFSACASDDLSTVKVIVFRPIRSAFTTLAGYGGKLLQLVVDSI